MNKTGHYSAFCFNTKLSYFYLQAMKTVLQSVLKAQDMGYFNFNINIKAEDMGYLYETKLSGDVGTPYHIVNVVV